MRASPPSPPFVDPESGRLDVAAVRREALPIGKLVGVVVLGGLGPLALAAVFRSTLLLLPALLGALVVLGVGGALVALYVIVRSVQLSIWWLDEEGCDRRGSG